MAFGAVRANLHAAVRDRADNIASPSARAISAVPVHVRNRRPKVAIGRVHAQRTPGRTRPAGFARRGVHGRSEKRPVHVVHNTHGSGEVER